MRSFVASRALVASLLAGFTLVGCGGGGGSGDGNPPGDTTPPALVSVAPASAAIGVARSATIRATFDEPLACATVTFSEAMDPATLTAASFTLQAGAVAVAGTVEASGATATFTPAAPLAHATAYTATVTTAASDLAGNSLGAPAAWTFTTVDAPGGMRLLLDRYGDLYPVREDGGGLIRFTNSVAPEAFVGIGPGGMVVYQVDGRTLYAVPADGSAAAVPLVNTAASVAFRGFTSTGRAVYAIGGDLYSVTLDGLTTSTLSADPDASEEDPHFAPSRRVVFRSQVGCGYGGHVGVTAGNRVVYRTGPSYEEIALRSVTTGGADDLPLETQVGGISQFIVHPDGRVLYRKFDGTQGDVRCVDSASGVMVPLLSSAADEFPLGRIPGGRLLYGAAEPNSGSIATLHSVDAACADHQLLVESAIGGIQVHGFTSDGRVAYSRPDGSGGTALFLARHDGSPPVNLSQVTTLGAAAFYASVP